MKSKALITLILIPVYFFGQKSTNLIRLPVVFEQGYGAFPTSLNAIDYESTEKSYSWGKTYLEVSGIPKEWKNVRKGIIWLDAYQFVYQNYLAGNISLAHYEELQQTWQWIPNKSKLYTKPIKCYVHVVTGEDDAGKKWTILDTNNNLDFSDDKAFQPTEIISGKSLDSLSATAAIINYERFYKGKVIPSKIPLLLVKFRSSLGYSFPQHAVVNFKESGVQHKIAVGSVYPNFSHSKLVLFNDTLMSKKANANLLVSEGDYFTIENRVYKNRGIDLTNGILELEKTNMLPSELTSNQVHSKAIPFTGKEFTSQETISLATYKGKYLFIDFWGTWCAPCVKEIPNIKATYEKLDKTKIAFLGIAGNDNAASLKKFIEKENILWPQILSDETNKVVEAYRIEGYPTSLLINPEGVIVAKNLRGEDLYNTLNEFITK